MHKVKKAIGKLRDYLGRDTQGLKLLDDVAEITNELRKQSADAKEKANTAIKSGVASKAELVNVQATVQQLSQDLARESSLRQQRERDINQLKIEKRKLQQKLDELIPDLPVFIKKQEDVDWKLTNKDCEDLKVLHPKLSDPNYFSSMFNLLRRQMKYAPRQTTGKTRHDEVSQFKEHPVVYELGDLIGNYSGSELMKLGRFVATQAVVGFPCIIGRNESLKLNAIPDSRSKLNKPLKKFINWFQRHNIEMSDWNEAEAYRIKKSISQDVPEYKWNDSRG